MALLCRLLSHLGGVTPMLNGSFGFSSPANAPQQPTCIIRSLLGLIDFRFNAGSTGPLIYTIMITAFEVLGEL